MISYKTKKKKNKARNKFEKKRYEKEIKSYNKLVEYKISNDVQMNEREKEQIEEALDIFYS